MAFYAAARAEEQRFARSDVPIQVRLDRRRTQAANEADEVPNLLVGKRKRRHVRSGHALPDGFEQLLVVGAPHFAAVDQAGADAAFAVRSVARGAGVEKLGLACLDGFGSIVGGETDNACQRGQNPKPHCVGIISAPDLNMQPVGTGSQSDNGAADATPVWHFRPAIPMHRSQPRPADCTLPPPPDGQRL